MPSAKRKAWSPATSGLASMAERSILSPSERRKVPDAVGAVGRRERVVLCASGQGVVASRADELVRTALAGQAVVAEAAAEDVPAGGADLDHAGRRQGRRRAGRSRFWRRGLRYRCRRGDVGVEVELDVRGAD